MGSLSVPLQQGIRETRETNFKTTAVKNFLPMVELLDNESKSLKHVARSYLKSDLSGVGSTRDMKILKRCSVFDNFVTHNKVNLKFIVENSGLVDIFLNSQSILSIVPGGKNENFNILLLKFTQLLLKLVLQYKTLTFRSVKKEKKWCSLYTRPKFKYDLKLPRNYKVRLKFVQSILLVFTYNWHSANWRMQVLNVILVKK